MESIFLLLGLMALARIPVAGNNCVLPGRPGGMGAKLLGAGSHPGSADATLEN